MNTFKTNNKYGSGVVKSWASLLDDNTREAAEKVSRVHSVEGHVALMPDAHFGYGPPVGTVLKTREAIIPYSVGVDIGCGMIAAKLNLNRYDFVGKERELLGAIRSVIPSGVGQAHAGVTLGWANFHPAHGLPPGLDNEEVMVAALQRRHQGDVTEVILELARKARTQFATLGAGNHFVEVCETPGGDVWLVLHSGSRGVGNVLATAHAKLAKDSALNAGVPLEDNDLAWFCQLTDSFDAYIADMKWCQEYAMASRTAMMNELQGQIALAMDRVIDLTVTINCHHNYSEEIKPGMWLTRKGAINAENGRLGVIPGSMGAATYIVRGKGCEEALNTAPHGAGRMMSRGQARKEGNLAAFKAQMEDKTWQDRDAEKLLDEAPTAYKPIDVVIEDSLDLMTPLVKLSQFINYKGI